MKVLVAGDYCPNRRIKPLIEQGEYDKIFSDIKPIIRDSDYSIVNFETCINSSDDKPISKLGPNLGCSEKSLDALKWAGFNCVTLANNHFKDFGDSAVNRTLASLTKFGFDKVGGGNNITEASELLIKNINNKTLAVVNACEHEFSIATKEQGGSNPLNPIQQFYAIQEARKKADYVLVIIHGGLENYQLPSPRMQELYRYFIDSGADAVVNHHQHCYSGYEIYKNKPIFYGLGNFCFDSFEEWKTDQMWNEAFVVRIDFSDERTGFELIPVLQCGKFPTIELVKDKNDFMKSIELLNQNILNADILESAISSRYEQTRLNVEWIFEPYRTGILYKLFQKGFLPHFMTRKSKKVWGLIDYIDCETHRDRLLYLFSNMK